MKQINPKKPVTIMFDRPIWHHQHSSKLLFVGFDSINSPQKQTAILRSNAVEVRIYRSSHQDNRIVEYEVRHPSDSLTKGLVCMSVDDLKTAFMLSDNCEEMRGQAILDNYGGDVARQGMYIRYGNYLNIPGPGTGYDGDPNVSIYVDDKIKFAIQTLLW